MNILVIEDEAAMAALLKQGLEEMRFHVDTAADSDSGLKRLFDADAGDYSLMILDIMLPGRDGFEVVREVRRRKRTIPILMLTARDGVADRVKGLESGADDYLPKPFEFAELLARVRALLRREHVNRSGIIEIGDLTIDTSAKKVTRAGRPISLTAREYALLESLAANEGRILTREMILERVWRDATDSVSNTVEVHVKTLRRKLEAPGDEQDREREPLIHTIRGLGYTLRRPS